MPTDREILKNTQAASVGAVKDFAADPFKEVAASHRRRVQLFHLTADSAAANATVNGVDNSVGSWLQATLFNKSRLNAARIFTPVTITANASNFATINVTVDNGAGGAQTVILSNTTKPTANSGLGTITAGQYLSLGNIAAGTVGSIQTASDAHVCAAGSLIQVQVAKAVSGVALPAGVVIELEFEEV